MLKKRTRIEEPSERDVSQTSGLVPKRIRIEIEAEEESEVEIVES
jgi:hypothetical protein